MALAVHAPTGVPIAAMHGDWWACHECAVLIDRRDFAALAERAIDTHLDAHPLLRESFDAQARADYARLLVEMYQIIRAAA
jgi:hypothetical protein